MNIKYNSYIQNNIVEFKILRLSFLKTKKLKKTFDIIKG